VHHVPLAGGGGQRGSKLIDRVRSFRRLDSSRRCELIGVIIDLDDIE
jgi:hypothetical protein